jgi:hypothetical protein
MEYAVSGLAPVLLRSVGVTPTTGAMPTLLEMAAAEQGLVLAMVRTNDEFRN